MADKSGKQPLVLLFRGSLCEMSRREFAGIMRYAHDARWKVQTVEYASAAGNRFREIESCDLDVDRLLDFWKPSGSAAAELLDRQMRHPRMRLTSIVCGAPVLARRASTRRYACGDSRVVRALEHIRQHACEGIGRPDVISVMGCSPRLADIRFRETTGHSILDEIHGVRLEKAKVLLGPARLDLVRIASECGYGSLDDFRRVFRRYLGTTPSKWAK